MSRTCYNTTSVVGNITVSSSRNAAIEKEPRLKVVTRKLKHSHRDGRAFLLASLPVIAQHHSITCFSLAILTPQPLAYYSATALYSTLIPRDYPCWHHAVTSVRSNSQREALCSVRLGVQIVAQTHTRTKGVSK